MFQLPGYEIGQNLYQGMRHLVFRGQRREDGRAVILKILNLDDPGSEDLALFLHEFRTVQQLEIKGIVRALDTVVMADHLAIVLEDVNGTSLTNFMQQRALDVDVFLPMASRLAATLDAVHAHGIIHRDIKPDNIVIDQAGHPLISDFGLALGYDAPGFDNHHRSLAGSPAYLAPEQSGRTNRILDHRCDLYALGVCFFEMLTGELPFQHEEPPALIHAHLAVRPPVPHHRNPSIPKTLSAIVLKLLQKNPEDRYQSGAGLRADLDQCRDQRLLRGTISTFPLAQNENIVKLMVSNKLYGREGALQELESGLERVAQGSGEFAVVTGRPGVGKTALIRALYPAVQRNGGYLLEGRYEKRRREVPFSAIIDSFRGLVQQILTEPPKRLAAWRRRFELALGRHAALMIDVIPDLVHIVGDVPPVESKDPVQFRNQFESFIRALCRADAPLVLFLDDVQWVDLAGLSLLQTLAMSPRFRNLFIIIAFRNNEVGPSHPLRFVLETLEKNTNLNAVRLGRLNREHVRALIADSLQKSSGSVATLADLIWRKTGGAPLTVRRLMLDLFHRDLIRFDREHGWQWDRDAIEEIPLDEPLARLLQKQQHSLPEATVALLQIAACFGESFRITALAEVADKNTDQLGDLLQPAVQRDIIHRVRDGYSFHHDRLREGFAAALNPAERAAVHRKIGDLLYQQHQQKPSSESLFHFVFHYNAGINQISDAALRRRLALHNYEAGKRAFAASAFANAVGYFDMADDLWQRDDDDPTWLDLQQQRLAGRYLSGDHSRSELLLRELLPKITAPLERARLFAVAIRLRVHEQRNQAALDMAMEALGELGCTIAIHQPVDQAAVRATWQHWFNRAGDGQPDSLLQTPPAQMADPLARKILYLMADVMPAAFHVQHLALDQFLQTTLERSAADGVCSETAPALTMFAARHTRLPEDCRQAYQLSCYALQLAEIIPDSRAPGRCRLLHGVFHLHWGKPLAEAEHFFKRAVELCLENGDPMFAAFAADAIVLNSFMHGVSLEKVIHQALKYLPFLRVTRNQTSLDLVRYCLHQALLLAGPQQNPDLDNLEPFNESHFQVRLEREGNQYLIAVCAVVSLFTAVIEDDPKRAAQAVKRIQPRRAYLMHTQRHYEFLLLDGIVTARAAAAKPQPQLIAKLIKIRNQLQKWADVHPLNFTAGAALISAEVHALEDNLEAALHRYQEAVAAAKKNAAHAFTALIFQQIERCFTSHTLQTFAYTSSLKPQLYYRLWGMFIPGHHQDFRLDAVPSEQHFSLHRTHSTARKDLEDLAVGQALQVLAHQHQPPQLLQALIEIMVETAGADRAVLLLERERHFYIEAVYTPNQSEQEVLCSIPLEHYERVPAPLFHYVLRTKETYILNQDGDHPAFHQDPYFEKQPCASAACLPLSLGGHLIGLLYLENSLMPGLFTPNRLQVVQLIAAQAAVALRNNQLSAELHRARNDLEQSNQVMTRRVAGQTAEIQARDHELAVLERLMQVNKRKQNWAADLSTVLSEGLALLAHGERALFFSAFTKANHVSLVATVGYQDPPVNIDMPQLVLEETLNTHGSAWESGLYSMDRGHFPIQLFTWKNEGNQACRLVLLTICPEDAIEALLVFEQPITADDQSQLEAQLRKLARYRDHALSVYVKSKLMYELEQSNQELASAQEKLISQERMAAVGALAAGIGHEIRNPLNFINNFAMVSRELTQELAVLLQQQQQFIEGPAFEEVDLLLSDITDNAMLIQNHGERAAGIIKSMMLLSRGQSMHRELTDVNVLVDEYTDLAYHGLRVQQTSANVRVERSLDAGQPKIFAIPQDLSRVIINLINNAFYAVVKKKETSDDSFLPRIRVSTQGDDDYVQIRIYDNGTGIPAKLVDRVFNPFFTTKPAGEGTGLGLAICREIIEEQHHGEMSVNSEEGFFTEFRLRLPVDSRRTGRRKRAAQPEQS